MKTETKAEQTQRPFWKMLLEALLLLLLFYGVWNLSVLRQPCPMQLPWNGKEVAAPMIGGMAELRRGGTRIVVNCSTIDRAVYSATLYVWKDDVCLNPEGTFVYPLLTLENRTLHRTIDVEPGADYRICLDMKAGHGLRYLYHMTPINPRELTPMEAHAQTLMLIDVLDAATGEYLYTIQEQEDGSFSVLTQPPIALPTAG